MRKYELLCTIAEEFLKKDYEMHRGKLDSIKLYLASRGFREYEYLEEVLEESEVKDKLALYEGLDISCYDNGFDFLVCNSDRSISSILRGRLIGLVGYYNRSKISEFLEKFRDNISKSHYYRNNPEISWIGLALKLKTEECSDPESLAAKCIDWLDKNGTEQFNFTQDEIKQAEILGVPLWRDCNISQDLGVFFSVRELSISDLILLHGPNLLGWYEMEQNRKLEEFNRYRSFVEEKNSEDETHFFED